VLITIGWVWWRHQRAPIFSLASGPPNPKPTTGHNKTNFNNMQELVNCTNSKHHIGKMVAEERSIQHEKPLQLKKYWKATTIPKIAHLFQVHRSNPEHISIKATMLFSISKRNVRLGNLIFEDSNRHIPLQGMCFYIQTVRYVCTNIYSCLEIMHWTIA